MTYDNHYGIRKVLVEGSYFLRVEVELPITILGEELARSFERLIAAELHESRAYRDPKVHG
jgi:hypothetical protein